MWLSVSKLRGAVLAALAVALSAFATADVEAASPFLVIPEPSVAELSAAYRYSNMTDAEAYRELDRRNILYTRVQFAPGVRAPVRLTGRIHGVYFHSSLPPEERVSSVFEILDARLLLALDDFAAILERHDIDEVVHYTMYRPGGEAPVSHRSVPQRGTQARAGKTNGAEKLLAGSSPKSKGKAGENQDPKPVARTSKGKPGITKSVPAANKHKKQTSEIHRSPGRRRTTDVNPDVDAHSNWAPPGTRHPAGLAIDVGALHKRDGTWLSVANDFHGNIGNKTCGDGVSLPEDSEGRELHSIVCEASDLGIFTYVLTPNYNAAHQDHFHMEIKPGVRWFLYH